VVFSVAFLLPDTIKVPRIALRLIYSWIAYYIVKKYQGDQIDEHLGSGGLAYSWWRVIAISLIGVIVTLIPVIILVMIIMR